MTRLRLSAPLVYALLAVAVAGPLLQNGLVLAVDLVLVPHPHLGSDYWGLASGTHAGPSIAYPSICSSSGLATSVGWRSARSCSC